MDRGEDIRALSEPFAGYRISESLMAMTGRSDTIFMHCMPSQHGSSTDFAKEHPYAVDTVDAVFEGPQSRVFAQAENRMHAIKALLCATVRA
jgi:ornithine carbamoyltransferase